MNENFRNRNDLSDNINKSRNIIMAVLFIIMGVMMLFAEKLNIYQLLDFDRFFRYIFGFICLLYGGFRIWRAFKNKY